MDEDEDFELCSECGQEFLDEELQDGICEHCFPDYMDDLNSNKKGTENE